MGSASQVRERRPLTNQPDLVHEAEGVDPACKLICVMLYIEVTRETVCQEKIDVDEKVEEFAPT